MVLRLIVIVVDLFEVDVLLSYQCDLQIGVWVFGGGYGDILLWMVCSCVIWLNFFL